MNEINPNTKFNKVPLIIYFISLFILFLRLYILTINDYNYLRFIFYIPIGVGVLIVLFLFFYLIEYILLERIFGNKYKILSIEAKIVHGILIFLRTSVYALWGVIVFINLIDGIVSLAAPSYISIVLFVLVFISTFIADSLLLIKKYGFIIAIISMFLLPISFFSIIKNGIILNFSSEEKRNEYVLGGYNGQVPKLYVENINWHQEVENETYGEPVPTGNIDGLSISSNSQFAAPGTRKNEPDLEFYRLYGLELLIESNNVKLYKGIPSTRNGLLRFSSSVKPGDKITITFIDFNTSKVIKNQNGDIVHYDVVIPKQELSEMINNVLEKTSIRGKKVPPYPDIKKNNQDRSGIDSDLNGIRDDIDRLIATNSLYSGIEYAETLQLIMSGKREPELIKTYAKMLNCGKKYPKIDKVYGEILLKTLNTPLRKKIYENEDLNIKINKALYDIDQNRSLSCGYEYDENFRGK